MKDKNRFFEIARGSALECASIHDVLAVCDAIDVELNRRGKSDLKRIVSTFELDEPKICCLEYSGKALKYLLFLDLTNEVASISGDFVAPFGANSMYEIPVACDSVTLIPEGHY